MNWDNIADSYLGICDDREKILLPSLVKIIRENNVKKIVDIGGGDGRFVELLVKFFGSSWFSEMALTDTSNRMLSRAKNRLKGVEKLKIVKSENELKINYWDAITLIAVWMTLETEEKSVNLLTSIRRLLTKNGRLIAAVTHPCFRNLNFHSFSACFDLSDYFKSGKKFKVNLYDSSRSLSIWDTHWTISDHSDHLKKAGYFIESIVELSDIEPESGGSPWLIIVAKKDGL